MINQENEKYALAKAKAARKSDPSMFLGE